MLTQDIIISHLNNWITLYWSPLTHSSTITSSRLLHTATKEALLNFSVGHITPCLYGKLCRTDHCLKLSFFFTYLFSVSLYNGRVPASGTLFISFTAVSLAPTTVPYTQFAVSKPLNHNVYCGKRWESKSSIQIYNLVINNWWCISFPYTWEVGGFFYVLDARGMVGIMANCIYLWVDRLHHGAVATSDVSWKEFFFLLKVCVCPKPWNFCLSHCSRKREASFVQVTFCIHPRGV